MVLKAFESYLVSNLPLVFNEFASCINLASARDWGLVVPPSLTLMYGLQYTLDSSHEARVIHQTSALILLTTLS